MRCLLEALSLTLYWETRVHAVFPAVIRNNGLNAPLWNADTSSDSP